MGSLKVCEGGELTLSRNAISGTLWHFGSNNSDVVVSPLESKTYTAHSEEPERALFVAREGSRAGLAPWEELEEGDVRTDNKVWNLTHQDIQRLLTNESSELYKRFPKWEYQDLGDLFMSGALVF